MMKDQVDPLIVSQPSFVMAAHLISWGYCVSHLTAFVHLITRPQYTTENYISEEHAN